MSKYVPVTRWLMLGIFPILLCSLRAFSQSHVIKGKVLAAENGSPLVGVTIRVQQGTEGAVSNLDGSFSLSSAKAHPVLVFSFTGYLSKTVTIGDQKSLVVALEVDPKALGEVVVVGYGTQKKGDVAGAITSVKSADIRQTPVANVVQGIQGRVPGVQITQNSAAPGDSVSMRIRGVNSINGTSEPLYVVDGVQLSNSPLSGDGQGGITQLSPLSTINPDDIESVAVLKDASATAIYGARGANGVVLISTKRGQSGKAIVTYSGYYGDQNANRRMNMMNATEFAQLENDIYHTSVYPNPDSLGEGVNWQDLIFRNAPIENHQISVSGGNDKTQFAMSGNYFKQDGVIINSDYTRYAFRLNLDHRVSNLLKVGTSLYTNYSVNNTVPTASTSIDAGAVTQSILGAAMGAPPTLKPYKEDGTVWPFGDQMDGRYREVVNPLGLAQILNREKTAQTLANIYAEFTFFKGFTYRANFDPVISSTLRDYYSPRSIMNSADLIAGGGTAVKSNTYNVSLLHESILTYQTTIKRDHALKVTGVFATQSGNVNNNTINASNFPNDATKNEALQLAVNRTVSSWRSKDRLDSYMGRINYGYKNRYLVDLITRVDGASKFGENNKYGFFPAGAVGWRVSEEPFMAGVRAISNLKLRASYGLTGNAGAIGAYQSLATVGATGNYFFNHVSSSGIAPTGIPNADLRWEKSLQADIGIDLSLFNSRLNFTADVYNKKTNDLLFVQQLPLSSGYSAITGNFASMQNRGVELGLDATILDSKVKWNVAANVTVNRNKLLSLAGGVQEYTVSNYSILKVGQPLGLFKTYIFDGIYQTGEDILAGSGSRTGGVKVKDLNNDKQITADDQRVIGNANPSFIYGFSTNVSYKRFDFSAFLSGVQGNKVYNLIRYTFENPLGNRNMYQALVNRWSPTNPSNEYVSGFQGGRIPLTDRFMEDGSYLRCKNLTLGYHVPFKKVISSARIYASVNNLFTITKYSGFDPEVNTFGNSNTLIGVDNLVYPLAKSYLLGVQVSF